MELRVNGGVAEAPPGWEDETLLATLREALGLAGAKFGCGLGQCGACTVLIDGEARRACLERTGDLGGARIVTIEGLAPDHPLKRAWAAEAVPQCGYCQAGQIMAAAALLARDPRPAPEAVEAALAGNLCRCGTYGRIRRAVARAAAEGAR